MKFTTVTAGMDTRPFEMFYDEILKKVYVRDETILQYPEHFPLGYIVLKFQGVHHIKITSNPLLSIRNRANQIIGYFTINVDDNRPNLMSLTKSFPMYLSLVTRVARLMKLDIDRINLTSRWSSPYDTAVK